MMLSCGIKEDGITDKLMRTFKQYRDQDGTIGFAHVPLAQSTSAVTAATSPSLIWTPACQCVCRKRAAREGPDPENPWIEATYGLRHSRVLKRPFLQPSSRATEESVWLPNEAVAKAYMEYVKTGAVGDTTPPPAPFNVTATPKGDQGMEVRWSAEADFESGIRQFIILRDGQELAGVPQTPVGKYGCPLFQSMTYHDTPSQPMPEMAIGTPPPKPGKPTPTRSSPSTARD